MDANICGPILHFNKKGHPQTAFCNCNTRSIYGVFVVSGGVVLAVSLTVVSVTAGVIDVESISVLSDDPDTFFVELHAEAASNIEPAKARLRIVLFIIYSICYS